MAISIVIFTITITVTTISSNNMQQLSWLV